MSKYIGATAVNLSTTSADVTGNADIGGNLTVDGNLSVSGTTTTIDSASAQTVDLGDNDKIRMGDGDDLQLYHDGTHSYVDDTGTGRLYLRGNDRVQIQKYTGEDMITAIADGAVKLYYDNSNKLETTSSGVSITGTINANNGANSTQAIFSGTSGRGLEVSTFSVGAADEGVDFNAQASGSTQALTFSTGGTERVRLNGSGHVIIGNTSTTPWSLSSGSGAIIRSEGYAAFTASGSSAIELNRTSSNGNIINLRRNGTAAGSLGASGGTSNEIYLYSNSGKGILLNNNGLLPATSSGGGSDNTTDLGQPDVRFRDIFISGGLLVGGTTSSNALDDYEEGTFTPNLKKGAHTSFTYVSRIGTYTKIGNVYKISFYVFCNNTSTTSNGSAWEVTNLPFNVSHLSLCAYQFIKCGYIVIGNTNYEQNNHRWQANSATALTLYGANASTEHTGSNLEFSGSGIITVS